MSKSKESGREYRSSTSASEPPLLGLWHLALWIEDSKFDATCRFYTEGMGMRVVWQPDPDNVYLSSGADNLALHRRTRSNEDGQGQKQQSMEGEHSSLDHLGFLVPKGVDVQSWHDRLELCSESLGCTIVAPVRLHRDGATSCYFIDPAGHKVQIVHIPEIEIPSSGIPR